ncbi:type VI secretion system lipoprotein TssJ [Variovorax sp. RHLX14]|uniref:type VI secretion system lipoprotein TssJ n=1 Tax=Variovorax sp. RHLX14 TaxID=1259731 RepID=UPI003F4957C6
MRNALRSLVSALFLSSVWIAPAAAQGFQPLREQTTLDITITAADDLNRDEKERASPVLVRLYELRSSARFEAADYFSLQSDDRIALSGDLLRSEEFILRPGEQKRIRRKSHPDIEAVALLVGYRELAQADWRAVKHIDSAPEAAWYRMPFPANRLKLAVLLQRQGIQVVHVD